MEHISENMPSDWSKLTVVKWQAVFEYITRMPVFNYVFCISNPIIRVYVWHVVVAVFVLEESLERF